MHKNIVIGLSVIALVACTPKPNPVTTVQLQEVEAGYGLVLSAAANYRELYDKNPCTVAKPLSVTNYCASRSVIVVLQNADQKVQGALVVARNFIKTNPTLDATSYVTAALNAVNDFRAVEAQYGVK